MIFKSLKSRILISIIGVITVLIIIIIFVIKQKVENQLLNITEKNAVNLLNVAKNQVHSLHKSIMYYKKSMMLIRKKGLRRRVDIAFKVIESCWNEFNNKKVSLKDAKQRAINFLRNMRYDNGIGYYWIINTKKPIPEGLLNSIMPEVEGKVLDAHKYNTALGKGVNLFKAMLDVCEKYGKGFVDYYWNKPLKKGLSKPQPKLSFVKLFKPWNWIVGTGVYIDDIEKDVKNRIDAVVKNLNKTLVTQRIGKSGHFFIFDEKNYFLVHPRFAGKYGHQIIKPDVGNKMFNELVKASKREKNYYDYYWDKPGHKGKYIFLKRVYVTKYKPLGWYICTTVYKEDFEQGVSKVTDAIILITILFLMISLIISFFISRSITKPLNIFIKSINKTDSYGIPTSKMPDTGIEELKILSFTINKMINIISISREDLKTQRDFSLGIINSSPYLICGLTPNGKTNFISNSVEYVTGYKVNEILNKNLWKIFFPGKESKQVNKLHKLLKDDVVDYEMVMTCKNGDRINVLWSSFSKKDNKNNVIEIVGFANNITLLKDVEEALRKSEEEYRILVETMNQGLAVQEEGRITFVNKSFCDITGYSRDDLVGEKIDAILGKENKEKFKKLMKLRTKGVSDQYELEYVTKSGRKIFLLVFPRSIGFDGKIYHGSIATFTDITKQKMVEQELKSAQSYLINIINSMPTIIIGVDVNCKVTQWNKKAAEVSGVVTDDAIGKSLYDLFPARKNDIDKISKIIKTGEIWQAQKKERKSGGNIVYEDLIICPLSTNSKNVEGAVILLDDVTDRVRMEEMMIQSEKMLSVGGLAAGMAHEINNPLSGMLQTSNVMATRLSKNKNMPANLKAATKSGTTIESIHNYMNDRGIFRMIKAIKDSGQRIADVVDNMLSFARKSDSKKLKYNIAELLDKTLELAATDYNLKKHYDFKLIDIYREYDNALPLVSCEKAKLQQVFLNIFRNGAQAMQEAKQKKPKLVIKTKFNKENNEACIEIEDNGFGIDESIRKRIFEPFFTTKPSGVGTGLGLSVSYFIITEDHGGKMEVESQPDSGAKFIIRLPVRDSTSES